MLSNVKFIPQNVKAIAGLQAEFCLVKVEKLMCVQDPFLQIQSHLCFTYIGLGRTSLTVKICQRALIGVLGTLNDIMLFCDAMPGTGKHSNPVYDTPPKAAEKYAKENQQTLCLVCCSMVIELEY